MVADAGSGGERVRVIVVNHDAGDVTLRCLDALARTEWPPDQLDVVLVDNASSDGVVEEVRRTRPDVSVIASAENEGFGRACNRGMGDLAGIDHVALINNDAVPEPDWLVPLVAALAADGELGAVSPKVLLDVAAAGVVLTRDPADTTTVTVSEVAVDGAAVASAVVADERFRPHDDGRAFSWSTTRTEAGLWWPVGSDAGGRASLALAADHPTEVVVTTAIDRAVVAVGPTPAVVELRLPDKAEDVINSVGGVLYEGWFAGDRGYLELDRGQYDDPAEVFSWSGAAVLLRAAYLRDVGRFNPAFFLYYEDLELSWRGRLRGWRYRTVADSVIRHRHGFTTGIGSERFRAWEDRSRWMTLAELAPWPVALRAVGGGVRRGLARGEQFGALSGLWPAVRGRGRLTSDRRRGRMDLERWLRPRPGGW